MHFVLNGYLWAVQYVEPLSDALVDRTGHLTVATTDPLTHTIYLSSNLEGDFLNRVLIHELGHATMISFDLARDIHRMVKKQYWVEAEEWVCNFIADYGIKIYAAAYEILGEDAWLYVPYRLEQSIG